MILLSIFAADRQRLVRRLNDEDNVRGRVAIHIRPKSMGRNQIKLSFLALRSRLKLRLRVKWREMGQAGLNILKEIVEACSADDMTIGELDLGNSKKRESYRR